MVNLTLIVLNALLWAWSPATDAAFSFAVIADPHINGNPDHKARLETVIDWIISNKDCKDIELVFVLGDIAWGGPKAKRNQPIAKAILDRLNDAGIPYVPIIGDNEVQTGCEKEFAEVFAPQYELLTRTFNNCRRASVAVAGMYLQNFSFDYKDCHFVCPDFNSRKAGDEGAELHDFEGGTWPWFKNDLQQCRKSRKENIVIMTHIGMFRTGFEFADQFLYSADEMEKIKRFVRHYKDNIDSNYAGHLHINWHASVWSALFVPLYHVRVTDETWSETQWPEVNDHGVTVRWVQVDNSGSKISYRQNVENISKEASVEK